MANADRAAGRTDPLAEKAGTDVAPTTGTGSFTNPSTASTMSTKSSATAPTEASTETSVESSTDTQASKDATTPAGQSNVFGEILGMGGSCFVSVVGATTVHKGYEIWVNGRCQSHHIKPCKDDLRREATVYEHMGPHPNAY